MAGATEECNEKHLTPWSQACSRDGIFNTPLSPYLDRELLYNNHLRIDGSKIESSGFSYHVPKPTRELLQEVCKLRNVYVYVVFGKPINNLVEVSVD